MNNKKHLKKTVKSLISLQGDEYEKSFTTSLTLLTVCVCHQPHNTRPASALGDSPTIKGTIANLAKAELDTSALTIKAVINTKDSKEKVIAQGTVSSSGVFSIKLPGLSLLVIW